jgi:hypothetical protein
MAVLASSQEREPSERSTISNWMCAKETANGFKSNKKQNKKLTIRHAINACLFAQIKKILKD